jgi:pyruvate dehydrogenase E1 component beta subunit
MTLTSAEPGTAPAPRQLSFMEAISEGLSQQMALDSTVVAFGEDSVGGMGASGELGNAWGPTKDLYLQFPDRVFDTPITESAFVGAAVGAAMTGLRPVTDILFVDFIGVCFDQILNQAAKVRYTLGGTVSVPMVVRTMWGAGMRRGVHHSQALYPLVTHIPGLKVAIPATPYDAKGLMIEAIRDDDPVIFFEHKMLYYSRGEVPEEPYTVPFGRAAVVREGGDCTVVAVGAMVHRALEAAAGLAGDGISCEVVDPRTVSPLDTATIVASISRTGRLVVVDEANPRCGVAADIAALAAREAWSALRAPVRMVTAPHAPTPFSPVLEDLYAPSAASITAAVASIVG